MRRELVFQRALFLVLVVCLGVSRPVLGQRITGDIAGEVTDSTGAVVPNVTVTAVNTGTNLSRSGVTSETGAFRIPELPIGTYRVTASAEGFKSAVQTVDVQAGAVIQASFKLTVGQRTETVEVEGTAPLVELSPNNNNYVDNEKIENVPLNGRDFNSLLAITPGVQRTPGGGFQAISINGSKVESNNYFIDGLYNNDRYYGDSAIGETGIVGIPAVLFPPEAIEELSIQETPSAEFGVKGGAPILLNMKSGTNTWHGSGTWVNHSGFGDASNYFSQGQKTPIHNNQFNATIGGPIVKDKAFMFLFYEGQRYKSLAVSSRTVPTPDEIQGAIDDITLNHLTVDPVGQALLNFFPTDPSGVIIAKSPTTASANTFGVKFDYRLNDKNSLAVRYIFGDSLQSAPPYAGLPPGPGQPADLFNSVAPSRAQMAGVSLISNFGTNKILESRRGLYPFRPAAGHTEQDRSQESGRGHRPAQPSRFWRALRLSPATWLWRLHRRSAGLSHHHAPRPDLGLVRALFLGEGKPHRQIRRQLPARLHQQPAQQCPHWNAAGIFHLLHLNVRGSDPGLHRRVAAGQGRQCQPRFRRYPSPPGPELGWVLCPG